MIQQCTEERTDVELLRDPVSHMPLARSASSFATETTTDGTSAVSLVAITAWNDVMRSNDHIEPEKEKDFGTK